MFQKLSLYPAIFIICISFIVSGCSQVELASHYTKKLINPSPTKSKGTYKVGSSYKIAGKRYYPKEDFNLVQTGIASWYGPGFHGKKTANGEIYDQYAMTAAHKTLQLPAIVKVTNLENNRSIIVRINDRGPYSRGRIIDLSKAAAKKLGIIRKGTARVRLQVMTNESRKIASIAKTGRDTSNTRYTEVNHRQYKGTSYRKKIGYRSPVVSSKQPAYLSNNATMDYEPMGRVKDYNLPESLQRPIMTTRQVQSQSDSYGQNITTPNWNKPVKENSSYQPMVKTNNVYIQAGAFSVYDNANKLSQKLSRVAPVDISEIQVKKKRFYRVRLGPVKTVQEARLVEQNIRELGYSYPTSIVVDD